MARYTGPRLRIIRRLGTALPGLKRTDADLRRPYPPGQHGPTRRLKLSNYALRLMEKQKVRFHYGVSEKGVRRYMVDATRRKGNAGVNFMQNLESRLDNVVYRMGLAPTMPAARQMTTHKHITVNGKGLNIPSYKVQVGDVIAIKEKSSWKERALEAMKDPNNLETPSYLEVVQTEGSATFTQIPATEDVPLDLDVQLIIEFYSGK